MSYSEYTLHLWSMTTGQPHPAAENPIISYPRITSAEVYSISITNSRLAILVRHSDDAAKGTEVTAWDWRTGRILLVSEPLTSLAASVPQKPWNRTAEIPAASSWSSLTNIRSWCSWILGQGTLHSCKSSTRNGARSRNQYKPRSPSQLA